MQTSAHGDIWEKGISAFGQLPSDLTGKRVNLDVYPQHLPLIMRSKLPKYQMLHLLNFPSDVAINFLEKDASGAFLHDVVRFLLLRQPTYCNHFNILLQLTYKTSLPFLVRLFLKK